MTGRTFISRHFQEAATILVEAAGMYNDRGIFEPGAITETPVIVVSWPPTGMDASLYRDILPDGARISEARWFGIQQEVAPLRVGTAATNGDGIRYEGIRYTVRVAQPWRIKGFQVALATRDEGQDG